MILQQLHIDGFGKLTNLDLTFSENLNLICGDNEAGKSTLCSFIFHMLYGLERSRGRASRFDAYIHFLPWHASAYGGSLTFSANGASWFLERSFLADSRFIRLTRLDDGMIMPHGEDTLAELLSHVNQSSYRAIFYLSGQSCADISALSGLLRQYTQNLPGSGSMTFSATQAIQKLKRQKKEALARLSGATPGDLLRIDEELFEIQEKLCALTDPESSLSNEESSVPVLRQRPRYFLLFIGCLMLILGIVFLIYPPISEQDVTPYYRYLPAGAAFAAGLFGVLFSIRKKPASATSAPDLCTTNFSPAEIAENNYFPSTDNASNHFNKMQTLLERSDVLNTKKTLLEEQLTLDEALRGQIDAFSLAIDTISDLSTRLHHTYSPALQRSFARHASALTGRPFSQLIIDESFHLSLMEEGRLIPVEALSRGTVEQLMFACRLASIDLLFSGAELPFLLDDIFSSSDDTRLSVLLARLNADYPGQKLIFSCQKREAAILSQHSLSYHLIQL